MNHDDLATQIERLRLELQAGPPTVANNLTEIERHLLWQRDATIGHIRHIASIRDESDAMIRAELEALRTVLVRSSAPVPAAPPVPKPTNSAARACASCRRPTPAGWRSSPASAA